MKLKDFPDNRLLTNLEVLKRINYALKHKKPFSLVRIGDGENTVLGQYTVFSKNQIINSRWYKRGKKKQGVTLPNVKLRNQMIKGIKKANLVGICRIHNDPMLAPEKLKRSLTNRLFSRYHIRPKSLCHVFVNRRIVSYQYFWRLLHRYRIVLISKWAKPFADLISKKYPRLKPNIVGCINFTHYKQIPATLRKLRGIKFDLALISTGVNAVILAPAIAERFGKVAIDFGHTMMFAVTNKKTGFSMWEPEYT